jgi:peptide/nickel transport system ATP-binding protein
MTLPLLTVSAATVYARSGADRSTIVRDVDFTVGRGESLGVVGESGSGKSMVMKAVLGLLPRGTSATGEITYDGRRIDGLSERQFRQLRGRGLSLLLQDPFTILNPLQTVATTIAETLRPEARKTRAQTRAEVERRLGEVGIETAVAWKRPFQLSGGMRQRVAIAAALAADPELLVADEPTTALDVQTQDEVLRLLSSLRSERGLALILITHDLRVAFDVCDRVMVMYAGSVLEQAPANEMQVAPHHPYTAGLMAAEPSVTRWMPDLKAMSGSVPGPDTVTDTCAFSARCSWVEAECTTTMPLLVPTGDGRASRCRCISQIAGELLQLTTDPLELQLTRPEPQTVDSPLLVVRGLKKTFRTAALVGGRQSHIALRGVDLDVGEGEAVGLVGESGSGKTTIARSLLGLSTADEGTIHLNGIDISDYRKLGRKRTQEVRKSIQVVFQDPYASLNPSLTIGRTLREAIEIRGGRSTDVEREIRATLERVNLPAAYANRLPAGLSGGERQRVSIARAVCLDPRLLICDEPVAALDVSVQAQVLELLRSLRDELGMAVLFITHDLAVVRQMTDRVLVLNRGEVVEAGPTDEVLNDPQHSYTRALIAAIPGQPTQTELILSERNGHD